MLVILFGALVVGLTLGMLGSGGSAITVPLLIYLVGHGAKESIAESMAIVGLISMAAAIPYAKAKQIDWRSVWCFGLPGMAGTLLGAWLGGLAPEALQLVVFAVVLLAAAYSMLKKSQATSRGDETLPEKRPSSRLVALQGTLVGTLTGFVGVGGGFLIVPALVLLSGLPMRIAIGTSLVIIIFNAIVGFAKYEQYLIRHETTVDGKTIFLFATIGIVGSLLGRSINERLNQRLLRQVFACFLIGLGSFVIIREGNKLFEPTPNPSSAATSPVSTSHWPQVRERQN